MAQRNGLLQKLLNDPERRVTNQRFVIRQPRQEPNLDPIFDRPATPPPPNRPINPKIQFARLMQSGKSISKQTLFFKMTRFNSGIRNRQNFFPRSDFFTSKEWN